jgi:hypothetical protein
MSWFHLLLFACFRRPALERLLVSRQRQPIDFDVLCSLCSNSHAFSVIVGSSYT